MVWMWRSSFPSTTIATLTTLVVAAMYRSKGPSSLGATKIGGLVRKSLISSKAF